VRTTGRSRPRRRAELRLGASSGEESRDARLGFVPPRGVTRVQNEWSDVPTTPEGPIMERRPTTVVAATKVSLSLSLGVDGELEEGVDGLQR
jgi:hypothetical protein